MARNRGILCGKTKKHGSQMRPAVDNSLLTNTQTLDQRAIASVVGALEVIKELATTTYQTQQSAT
jgi:hypothetical protein